jgi:hypothetical protein
MMATGDTCNFATYEANNVLDTLGHRKDWNSMLFEIHSLNKWKFTRTSNVQPPWNGFAALLFANHSCTTIDGILAVFFAKQIMIQPRALTRAYACHFWELGVVK